MKRKYVYLAAAVQLVIVSGCFSLDKEPEAVLSSETVFGSTGEMKKYLDQFYESAFTGHPYSIDGGIAFGDMVSDNLASASPNTRLNAGLTLADGAELTNYTYIRNVNFLLNNLDRYTGSTEDTEYKQCIGEAYFFRASYYFGLLQDYGGVTWVDTVLEPDLESLQLPRDSRTFIADKILEDLDLAIENLQPQSSSATMRVHKDVARIFKSEVALFEATWEKYHRAEGDEFYDTSVSDLDSKIDDYLQQAVDAVASIVDPAGEDYGRWSIYSTGDQLNDYRNMFITLDLSSNPEVLLWKKYDNADNIGHSVTRYQNQGGGQKGPTASLVDDNLTIDGRPFIGQERLDAKRTYGDELLPTVRDPRLSQTVCTKGQSLRPDDEYIYTYPPFAGSSYNQNVTGYAILKYVETDPEDEATIDGEGKRQAPAIQFRYADALLNYAEALAELDGAGNAEKIKAALKPLRDRVGMPEVDFDREYNTSDDYPFKDLDKYIQAVRRERRVEKAFEAERKYDIFRWAAADVLIKGWVPTGALFDGSDLEGNSFYTDEDGNSSLVYDQSEGNNLFLTDADENGDRYVVPFDWKSSPPSGYQFNLGRDYLLPIRSGMISLTGNLWEQNPGW